MTKSLMTATALAAALAVAGPGSLAAAGPVQLAQMNVAPKIQPAPPPNLTRTPVITPRIDTRRLAGEKDQDKDDGKKETAASPERVPQETATRAVDAPELVRQSPPPPAARLTRAPLPQVKPDLLAGIDPSGALDANEARAAAEAREAAEAAAAAGVAVERSDLSGLGDPMAGDKGGGPEDPRLGGMSPEEFKERFGLGGVKSPEDIAAGLATQFNDLGNRGVSSPAGDVAAGLRPDPSRIPKDGLASDEPTTAPDGTIMMPPTIIQGKVTEGEIEPFETPQGFAAGRETFHADGTRTRDVEYFNNDGTRERIVINYDRDNEATSIHYREYDADGQLINEEITSGDELDRLHTREGAPGGLGGCLPSDGSAACRELRRLQREGNTPQSLLAGSTRVNPGDPDDGTGSGPRLRMGEQDLVGNPDPNALPGGGGGRSARSFDGGALVNDEGGGTGPGLGQ